MKTRALPWILLLFAAAAPALAGPFYARGTFYAGTGGIWSCDAGNELFDDGQHGDGAADDGVHGAFVTADQAPGSHGWKIATADWSESYPFNGMHPLANAVLYLEYPGDVIHFRLDTNTLGGGWQPATNAVACDHISLTPGFEFELIGGAPELGDWLTGVPVETGEAGWFTDVTIGAPGVYEYKFRVVGTWDYCNLGVHYNMFIGDNFIFETTAPQAKLRFEFNLIDGRSRAVPVTDVHEEAANWGQLKVLYR
ncbi:MAG: hypothetical protein IPM94_11305 [bacterium]|nr:hypothetical protein [bacterium]